jgi:vancomycin resistance protein YoaR
VGDEAVHKKMIYIVLAVCLMLLLGGVALSAQLFFWSTVYPGVSLEGVDMGGRNKTEILQILTLWCQKDKDRSISIYYGDRVFNLPVQSIDFTIDIEDSLDEIWNVGRKGNLWERIKNIKIAVVEGYPIPVRIRYNEHKLDELVDQWKEAIEKPPRNAAFSILTGGLVPQEQGRKLETQALKQLILQALRKSGDVSVAMPVTPLYPHITVSDIKQVGIDKMLSTYTTRFDAGDKNRTANIKRAVQNINGYIVYSEDTFSFNEVVGPRDKNHGFKEAMEIVDNQFVPGIGGGVCQVSSTLYNAVLLADLAIVERYNHSKPLGYVPLGRDATVAFGTLDFKFANTSSSTLMIIAEVEGDKLCIGIFGQQPLRETIEVVAVEQQVIPPSVIKQQDQDMFLGENKVDRQGKPGYEVTTVRLVREQGKEIRREKLSKDRYLPEDTIIKVGTKMPLFGSTE